MKNIPFTIDVMCTKISTRDQSIFINSSSFELKTDNSVKNYKEIFPSELGSSPLHHEKKSEW